MDLRGKKALVLGAGGFIGSHLVEALLEKGVRVRAFIRYNSKRSCGNLEFLDKELRRNIEILFGDIRETEGLIKAMQDIDIVFNLAALVGIPYSYVNPHEVAMVNIIGTLNLLTAAKDSKVKKFIQTSTSEVYGSPDRTPIKETDTLKPQSPYSASKIGSDCLALSFFYSFGLPVSIIRPFNTYGPRQSGRAVIPAIIIQALSGNIVKLGSVRPRRDFVYVKDTIDGFIRLAESEKTIGQVINIGSGKDASILEVTNIIADILGKKLKIAKDTKRIRPEKSEVIRLLADNSKAKELLGWKPTFSLKEGLKLTIDFIKRNPNIYEPKIYAI